MSEKMKPSFKKLKVYNIREGYYPVKVILEVWDDGKSLPFIQLYSGVPPRNKGGVYKHNQFKISSKEIWNKIKKVVDEDLIFHIKKGQIVSEKIIEKQVDEEVERLKEDNLRLIKTIQAHTKMIKEYRKIKLSDYEKDVEELEKKIKSTKGEKGLQKFLAKTPWLLGLEYETSKPQKIAPGSRYDFYVEKYDGYADIVEIKKPDENIFDKNDKITSAFGKALQQLIEYIDNAIYYGNDKRLSDNMRFNFLKPKGILIIGRNTRNDKLKSLGFYFHNIEILTYDDVLERGKTILSHLQGKKRGK